jgi:transcriptional regulator with XRE-family HTH domain
MKVIEFVNLPAKKLADLTNIKETTLSKYFNSRRDPSLTSIEKIAKKLDMKPEDVVIGIRMRRENKKIACLN